MKRSPSSVRLQVESLGSRELPSSFLSDFLPSGRFSSSQPQTVQSREAARRTQCRSNLKQLGLSSTNFVARVPILVFA